MTRATIEQKVRECIMRVAEEQSIPINEISPDHEIVADLGFKSIDVATLTAFLESSFQVDPFTMGLASITEIRTYHDICNLYERTLNKTAVPTIEPASETDERMLKRLARKTG